MEGKKIVTTLSPDASKAAEEYQEAYQLRYKKKLTKSLIASKMIELGIKEIRQQAADMRSEVNAFYTKQK